MLEDVRKMLSVISSDRKEELLQMGYGDLLEGGVDYHCNYYFCPVAFCYECQRPLTREEIDTHEHGLENIYFVPQEKMDKYARYVGPLTGKFTPNQELCSPCCFIPKTAPKRFKKLCPDNLPEINEKAYQSIVNLVGQEDWNEIEKIYRKLCTNLQSSCNVPKLKGMAKALGINGYSKMSKKDLCAEIGAKMVLKKLGLIPI